MATRSTIAQQTENGIVIIYCHWDGYSTHHMPILKTYYNTPEKVNKLMSLGNLSSLDNSPECPEGHSFDTPVEGYCIAFGRDRKEKNQKARIYPTYKMALKEESQAFNYLFDGTEWSYE